MDVIAQTNRLHKWENFPYNAGMTEKTPPSVVPEALAIAQPLVTWLLRSGVGYGEFVAALKPLFLVQAERELQAHGHKVTDSALSLLSGLHRKDVRALRESAPGEQQVVTANRTAWGKASTANQVATHWMGQADLPDVLPLQGPAPSFESIAQSVSRDVHPRSVLQELQRLGIVREADGQVHLLRHAFVPDAALAEARALTAGAVADHLHAGVHNLTTQGEGKFLEQSVCADGLSPESVQQLQQLANTLWAHVLEQVVQAASPLCEQDLHHPDPQRFRLGLFSYSAADPAVPSHPPAAADGESSTHP